MFDFMDFATGDESYTPSSGPVIPEPVDCMRCGICLNSCPTYQLGHDEQEGPRQRIRTLSRLMIEQQQIDDAALEHLQNCLQCRACETVCPSRMDYSVLFDRAKAELSAAKKRPFLAAAALQLIARKQWFNALLPLIKFYQLGGLRNLFRKTAILKLFALDRVDRIAPVPALTALKLLYPVAAAKGTVALFSGCIGDRFDRETLVAAIKILNRIGYEVLVPEHQTCCGAIHYHNGEQEKAKKLMLHNVEVFSSLPVDAIVYCATGCGGQLQEYQLILEDDEQKLSSFQGKLFEISEFVQKHWPRSLNLRPCRKSIRVHEPCSQRNILRNQHAVYSLLNRIPEAEVSELADNHLCCGAGGSYLLTHPENADALRDLKWQRIRESGADYLVTTNIGCQLHLAAAEQMPGNIEIIHPISLIAELLEQS
ncbi:MAG: (Fe-S)-binding protein [Gammaproteobacteria bacterium]